VPKQQQLSFSPTSCADPAAAAACIEQFPGSEHVYLVGSESGSVYQCSKAYGSDYLACFSDHCMPVYAVKWNGMHPDIFLSCSADWSIKVHPCIGHTGGGSVL
jgi:dynein intermediate chain 1